MAVKKLKKVNLYNNEYSIIGSSSGGGGGGMAVSTFNRWLRFDFTKANRRSVKILGGTSIGIGDDVIVFDEDTSVDLSSYLGDNGADYYVFVNADGNVTASVYRNPPAGYVFIGQFHTLCVDVGSNVTGIVPTNNTTVGQSVTLQGYDALKDNDFYNFYTKQILSITTGNYYNVATIPHLLSGFKAGDILPESVWCLNFHPECKSWDGMVYCNSFDIAVDIYLQSGTSEDTTSEYGAVKTCNRPELNHWDDFYQVGKDFLNIQQFMSIAQGSNELTTIEGSYDHETTGGHVDVNNRRMVSFIGCEDCCGYVWQWNQWITEEEFNSCDPSINPYAKADGQGSLGSCHDNFRPVIAGGHWLPASLGFAGSRCFAGAASWLAVSPRTGGRGRAEISVV